MKKPIGFLLIFFYFTLNFAAVVIAQDKEGLKKANKKVQAKSAKPVTPFDITTEKLPAYYKGTDIVRLYTSLLRKAPLKKGEFETTEEHEKKIAAAITDDIYAFKIDKAFSTLSISPYNADRQSFQISLDSDFSSKHKSGRTSFIVKRINRSSKSYVGSNAFGARRLVTDIKEQQYGLAFINGGDFEDWSNITLEFPADDAKSLKGNIGVLLICELALFKKYCERRNALEALFCDTWNGNDLIFEDDYSYQATIDNPTAAFYERYFINVQILGIWVFDIRSGEVLLKKGLRDYHGKKQDTKT